jgi:hypothetical protein
MQLYSQIDTKVLWQMTDMSEQGGFNDKVTIGRLLGFGAVNGDKEI